MLKHWEANPQRFVGLLSWQNDIDMFEHAGDSIHLQLASEVTAAGEIDDSLASVLSHLVKLQ